MTHPPAFFFTDLDGTLLNHHDYRFDAALPAIEQLHALRIPLILTTSKTLAEVAELSSELGEPEPVIVENGTAMCFPLNADDVIDASAIDVSVMDTIDGYAVCRLASAYAGLRAFIDGVRERHGWHLRGFGDMSVAEVSERTGLDAEAASRALQRLCSEPFVWMDDPTLLEQFIALAGTAGLTVTRGGRFHHLMGNASKAQAMLQLLKQLGVEQNNTLIVALGDSENDRAMLEAADIAVVIRRHDGTQMQCNGLQQTLYTEQQGAAGWNAAVLQILQTQGWLGKTR